MNRRIKRQRWKRSGYEISWRDIKTFVTGRSIPSFQGPSSSLSLSSFRASKHIKTSVDIIKYGDSGFTVLSLRIRGLYMKASNGLLFLSHQDIRLIENDILVFRVEEWTEARTNRANREVFYFISNASFVSFATKRRQKVILYGMKKKWFHFEYSFHFYK